MYFATVTAEELLKLREGLDILSKLEDTREMLLDVYIYGISSDMAILDAAKEAIAAESDERITEENVQLSEVAIAIPLSSDIIYYLTGSGLKLNREEFAYTGEAGEGVRELGFQWARMKPTVIAGNFSQMALASSSSWLDRFLRQYGTKAPAKVKPVVERSVPTQPEAMALETPTGRKETSLKISDVVTSWLNHAKIV